MGISLISLGKGVECYLFCPKRAEANFVMGNKEEMNEQATIVVTKNKNSSQRNNQILKVHTNPRL